MTMGLNCSKVFKGKLTTPEKHRETNKRIYLCNEEGEGVSSLSMRGMSEARPVLSAETTKIVLDSWSIIKKEIERVGVVTFMGLLEDDEVKSSFISFRHKTAEELLVSRALRSHALRVMGAVDKVVTRLGEPENLITLLHDLGQRHLGYNAKAEFLDLVGPQFNNAIQPALGDQWTAETEQAWADLFRYITHVMKENMIM